MDSSDLQTGWQSSCDVMGGERARAAARTHGGGLVRFP